MTSATSKRITCTGYYTNVYGIHVYIYNYIALYRDLRKILFFEACVGEKSHITNPYDTKSLKLQDREQKQAGSYFLMEE